MARSYTAAGWRSTRGRHNETRFTAGTLAAQVTIAEAIARHSRPRVLLPAMLPPVPILVQAGDDPATLLAAWGARRAALPVQ